MWLSGTSLLEDGIYDHATSEKLFCLDIAFRWICYMLQLKWSFFLEALSWLGSPLRGNTDLSYDCCPEKISLFTWRSCGREVLRCRHVHAVGALPHLRSPGIDLLSLTESDGYHSCTERAVNENSKSNVPQPS